MEFDKEYYCLEQNTCVYSKSVDLDHDCQLVLPQYCDDILRVVKCCSKCVITSVDTNQNEIKIYGKIITNITYLNENDVLSYVDFEEEFSKSLPLDNTSDSAFVWANCVDKYTNFRVINQRRIDVHQSSILIVKAYDKSTCPCVKSCNKSKLRKSNIKISNISATNITKCEFEETITIPTDSNPIKRIVGYSGFVTHSETKTIKDKALVKASVSINVLYTQDTEDEQISKCEHCFDVSKIIDIPGLDEDNSIITNLNLANVFLKSKNGANDCLNTIEIIGDINILNTVINEKQISVVTDGYIVNKNTSCSYSDFSCYCDAKSVCDTLTKTYNITVNDDLAQVIDVNVCVADSNYKNNNLVAKINTELIYKNADNNLTSCSFTNEIQLIECDISCSISAVSIQSFDYIIKENGCIQIRVALKYNAYLFNECNIKILAELDCDDNDIDYPALTIYFGKENESVWNIAKSFSSDVDMIIKENNLQSDVLITNKVLIIPGV